ncbi:sperm surface protein Sp17 isoform X3 [Thunnus thynnus]|uniref:sperm surface protein Sp17 isoform X3 n=1 Tax=Thunnus thynnus TaxID=8237 RepID=UPI003528BED7
MSVPFSNNHLRVPRGFGTVLEGLVREVLRDQPDDIPKYAADYFSILLKQREDSGMDPAEWAAKLEDRFYNNHAFKASPQKEPATEVTFSKRSVAGPRRRRTSWTSPWMTPRPTGLLPRSRLASVVT